MIWTSSGVSSGADLWFATQGSAINDFSFKLSKENCLFTVNSYLLWILCHKIEKWLMRKLLFTLLAIFRGFNDTAQTSAYFTGDFSWRCQSNAARKFPGSSLKARTLGLFGLRLDSSTLTMAAKPISISSAQFLMFSSDGSTWMNWYKLVAFLNTYLRIILSSKHAQSDQEHQQKKKPLGYQFGSLLGKHSTCETPFWKIWAWQKLVGHESFSLKL